LDTGSTEVEADFDRNHWNHWNDKVAIPACEKYDGDYNGTEKNPFLHDNLLNPCAIDSDTGDDVQPIFMSEFPNALDTAYTFGRAKGHKNQLDGRICLNIGHTTRSTKQCHTCPTKNGNLWLWW